MSQNAQQGHPIYTAKGDDFMVINSTIHYIVENDLPCWWMCENANMPLESF